MPAMSRAPFERLLIPLTLPWRQAAALMDDIAQGVLLAVDEAGRLARTVTDGDLRRALLQHSPDDRTVAELPGGPPLVAHESTPLAEIQKLMADNGISHVPVVDSAGVPVDLVTSRELSQRIWLSSPHLGDEESAFVADAFKTNWI